MGDTVYAFDRIAAARVGDELLVRRIDERTVVFAFWWCPDILAAVRLPVEVRFERRPYFRAGSGLKSSRFLDACIDRVGPEKRQIDVVSFGDCTIKASAIVGSQRLTVLGFPVSAVVAKAPGIEVELAVQAPLVAAPPLAAGHPGEIPAAPGPGAARQG